MSLGDWLEPSCIRPLLIAFTLMFFFQVRAISKNIFSKNIFSNNIFSNNIFSNKIFSNNIFSNNLKQYLLKQFQTDHFGLNPGMRIAYYAMQCVRNMCFGSNQYFLADVGDQPYADVRHHNIRTGDHFQNWTETTQVDDH